MAKKKFKFNFGPVKEQEDLYDDLVTEMYDQYGTDIIYIPLDEFDQTGTSKADIDFIFGEIKEKRWTSPFEFRMYLEDSAVLGGQGDLFSKFAPSLEIADEATFFTTQKEFKRALGDPEVEPRIGDLIFLQLFNSMFEVTFVEDQENKILGKQISWKLICKKYRASVHEEISTGEEFLDEITNKEPEKKEFPDGRKVDMNEKFEEEAKDIQEDEEDPFGDF